MKEKPASTKASSSLCEVASSAVQPNTLPPTAMGGNSMPDLRSLRFSMGFPPGFAILDLLGRGAGSGVDPAEAPERCIGRLGEFDADLGKAVEHAPNGDALDHARVLLPRRELELHDQRGILNAD